MIELRGIERVFEVGGRTVRALDGVDISVATAGYVAIMGASGAGKSTLLNILGCLDRPTAGSYQLDGEEVARLSDAELTQVRRHKIGFVFQSFHLVPRLSAARNVELPMIFAGVAAAERRRRVGEMLEGVGLAERASHRPEQLSGGERQRVAVARAMVMGPKILLADEPTGNLDTRSGTQVLALLEAMRARGLTLIVVTHDPAVARRAEGLIVLRDGKVLRRTTGDHIAEVMAIISGEENGEQGDPAEAGGAGNAR